MLTDTREGKELVNEVAFRIMKEYAPEERPSYERTRDKYFTAPNQFLKSRQPKNNVQNPLDMGGSVVIITLTEAIFPIVVSILSYIALEVGKALTDKASEELSKEAIEWTKSIFTKSEKKPLFTQEQLEEIDKAIREIAQSRAAAEGIEMVKVTQIRDYLIARLALAKK